jgi:hypothetical protein
MKSRLRCWCRQVVGRSLSGQKLGWAQSEKSFKVIGWNRESDFLVHDVNSLEPTSGVATIAGSSRGWDGGWHHVGDW